MSFGDKLRKSTNLAEPVASTTDYFCITEALFDNDSAKEIALNVTKSGSTEDIFIYRFRPDSTITISINWESFRDLKLTRYQKTEFRNHLERATNKIRSLHLGIQFHLVPEKELGQFQRGVIDVRYGGDGRLPHSAKIGWAKSEFPEPRKDRYTLEVFSTTFDPGYCDFIYNIMLHELAHFMIMRHHPWVQNTDWKNETLRLLYPKPDSNTKSIMGDWNELKDLEFSETDISECRDFYNSKAGLYWTQNLETSYTCRVWLMDVEVHEGIIEKTYS